MFSARASDPVTVLLVDDDDEVRGMCWTFLVERGFRVLEADNGLEARLTAMERKVAIDLVITDLDMPHMTGAELGRVPKGIWPDVNVLYMSGSSRENFGEELPSDCSFLAKPFAHDELVDAVIGCAQSLAEV